MAETAGRRMKAEIDGDFVVFLIGARFNNKLHLLRSFIDLGGRRGMKHMLDYLVAHPEKGLLGYEMGLPIIVQHGGRSGISKLSPTTRPTRTWPRGAASGAGSARATGRASGMRPTSCRPASTRRFYGNMPPFGLGKAGSLKPLSDASRARERLGAMT